MKNVVAIAGLLGVAVLGIDKTENAVMPTPVDVVEFVSAEVPAVESCCVGQCNCCELCQCKGSCVEKPKTELPAETIKPQASFAVGESVTVDGVASVVSSVSWDGTKWQYKFQASSSPVMPTNRPVLLPRFRQQPAMNCVNGVCTPRR